MEMNEIIEEINRADKTGKGTSAFTILTELYDRSDGSLKTTGSMSLYRPRFRIERHGKYVQVDIIFISALDTDMCHVLMLLNNFGRALDSIDANDNICPVFTLTIVPVRFDGKAYIQAMNPITWCKTTDNTAGSVLNTVRILFESIDFNAFENPDADPKAIEDELKKEDDENRFLMEKEELLKNAAAERNKELETLTKEEYLSKALYEDTKTISKFEDLL